MPLRVIYARKLHYTNDSMLVEAMKWGGLKVRGYRIALHLYTPERAGNSQDVTLDFLDFLIVTRSTLVPIERSFISFCICLPRLLLTLASRGPKLSKDLLPPSCKSIT
jgi:hypothetical protein